MLEGGISLVGVAGEGAMGTVYEGWQTQMERRVAVKMLRGDLTREHGFLERFMREARAIARLNHPNIVTVHGIGEVSDSPYLVMEFIEGATVSDEIEKGPIHPMRVIRIARQITSALADAHAAKVIHRDLKPSNILLTQRRRANDFVKLLDFGVAKLVDADAQLTREGFVFGTPAYLSPEQANGTEIDARSDLYSLGVCMYEMLTQKLPFTGNQVQLLLKHAREPAPPIRSIAPDLRPDLASLIDRLLMKDPDLRPRTAEDLADELDAMLGKGSPSPWASMALTAGDWTSVDLPHSSSPIESEEHSLSEATPTRAIRKQARPRPFLLAMAGLLLVGAGAGTATLMLRSLDGENKGANVAADAAPVVAEPATLPPDAVIDTDAPREASMFSPEDYAIRVSRPIAIGLEVYYEIRVDIWDEEGEPLVVDNIVTVFVEPQGERQLEATPAGEPGRYALLRRFDDPGPYSMKVYPPDSDPIELHFEVKDLSTAEDAGTE